MFRRYLTVFALLLLFGAARLLVEPQLGRDLRAAHFHLGTVGRDVRAQAGLMGFVAALSGLRAIVADFLWIRAHVAWQDVQWGRMKLLFDAVTSLAPRAVVFWEGAGWHMAYNASVAALQDESEPVEALRIRAQRQYLRLGEQYLLRGTEFNADRAALFDRLGLFYSYKDIDHCKASWAYFEAAKRPDAMDYVHRMAVYELSRCPGHEQQAYDMLVALYHRGRHERLPTLLKLIDELQKKLNIPPAARIDIAADLKEATPP